MTEQSFQQCLALCLQVQSLQGAAHTPELDALVHALQGVVADLRASLDQQNQALCVIDQMPLSLVITDVAGYITRWNLAAQRLFGYSALEATAQHILMLNADESADIDTSMTDLFAEHDNTTVEVRRRKKSGEVFRTDMSLTVLRDDDHNVLGFVAIFSEIDKRLSSEEMLRMHASIIENSDQGILITNGDERIVSVNAAFTRITGYTLQEAVGQTIDLLRSGAHDAEFRSQVRAALNGSGPWQGEIIGRRKNGEIFPQSVSISVVRNDNGSIAHAFSIFSDISVMRASEERMQRLVNYDNLTGLPNRTLFDQLVGQALALARRNHDCCVVLALDLNRFAAIKDTLGSDVADELLRQVGQRWRKVLRDQDILARVGSAEFVAALPSVHKREHSGLVSQKLLSALDAPFDISANRVHIEASIGISVFPENGMDAASLLLCADVAAKRLQADNEPGYLFYSPEMNQRAKEQWQLEGDLRHALASGDLLLHYQPKVSLRSGRIVGAEALIRWKHPHLGMVPPAKFIPVAEETALILDIGSWVIEEACRQIRAWMDSGITMPPIAVNLSARQFDRMLPARLQAVMDRHGVPPDKLKLEITESLLVRGPETVIPIMNDLVAMGLALAMDDFGTGYSSLANLKRFPITTLKIDRAFVIGVPDDENDCAIARAIVTMGQQLRQEIVAEGIETIQQMKFLRDLGCDQLQGFLFSPGIPAAAFERMVHDGIRLKLDYLD